MRGKERPSELLDRSEVRGGQAGKQPGAAARQLDEHAAAVSGVAAAPDEVGPLAPVHEADGALMFDLELVGELGDSGSAAGRPADEEEELILRRRDFRGSRELLGGVKEPAQSMAPIGESLVIRVSEPLHIPSSPCGPRVRP